MNLFFILEIKAGYKRAFIGKIATKHTKRKACPGICQSMIPGWRKAGKALQASEGADKLSRNFSLALQKLKRLVLRNGRRNQVALDLLATVLL